MHCMVEFELQVKMEDEPIEAILVLDGDEFVERISCGALFTLVLTNKGRVFGCGYQGTDSTYSHINTNTHANTHASTRARTQNRATT